MQAFIDQQLEQLEVSVLLAFFVTPAGHCSAGIGAEARKAELGYGKGAV